MTPIFVPVEHIPLSVLELLIRLAHKHLPPHTLAHLRLKDNNRVIALKHNIRVGK
jgi:hypothetical protein